MGRIRTIKPELFTHADLYDLEVSTGLPMRISWAGLFTACDREGRFKWKPRELKVAVLPYDEVDFSRVLDALLTRGFVVKYEVDGKEYGCIPTWTEHQSINNRESDSVIPKPTLTPLLRVTDASQGEGKGKEGKGREDASRDAEEKGLLPEMIAQQVLIEASLSGRELMAVLTDIAKAESKKPGYSDIALKDSLVKAWTDFSAVRAQLEFPPGAQKFFGEGYWRDRKMWKFKAGEEKPRTAAENMERARR